jgi:hypothetical protein
VRKEYRKEYKDGKKNKRTGQDETNKDGRRKKRRK